jgi:hypothetical protein
VLALVFVAWYASERTLSIHTIYTTRREARVPPRLGLTYPLQISRIAAALRASVRPVQEERVIFGADENEGTRVATARRTRGDGAPLRMVPPPLCERQMDPRAARRGRDSAPFSDPHDLRELRRPTTENGPQRLKKRARERRLRHRSPPPQAVQGKALAIGALAGLTSQSLRSTSPGGPPRPATTRGASPLLTSKPIQHKCRTTAYPWSLLARLVGAGAPRGRKGDRSSTNDRRPRVVTRGSGLLGNTRSLGAPHLTLHKPYGRYSMFGWCRQRPQLASPSNPRV